MTFAEASDSLITLPDVREAKASPSAPTPVDNRLTVAVALCSYNGEAYLQEQLESLAAQTRLPDEVVIGDDHSTDLTLKVIERFRVWAPFPVRLFTRSKNIGTCANFTETAWSTRKDIVFLSDQDDRWVRHKIERMIVEFERRPNLLVLHTNARLVDAQGHPLGTDLFNALELSATELERVRSGRAFDAFVRRNLATGATMAVRRRLLDVALPTPDDWIHDEWLATIAAGLGNGTVAVLEEPLIDYRQHGKNQIGARRLTLAEKIERMLHNRESLYAAQLSRSTTLLHKLNSLGPLVPDDKLALVQDKLRHLAFRATLPRDRIGRLVLIAKELAAGRYRRHSTGIRAAVRDVFGKV